MENVERTLVEFGEKVNRLIENLADSAECDMRIACNSCPARTECAKLHDTLAAIYRARDLAREYVRYTSAKRL